MHEPIRTFVNSLFRSAPATPENEELRQEVLQNALDRYDDLIARGENPQKAYTQVINSIGDINRLIHRPAGEPKAPEKPAKKKRPFLAIWIAVGAAALATVLILPLIAFLFSFNDRPAHYRGDGFFDRLEDAVENYGDQLESELEDMGSGLSSTFSMLYDEFGTYTEGAAAVPADRVEEIYIDWPVGQINVAYHNGSDILLEETDTDLPLYWRVDEETLEIRFCKPGNGIRAEQKTLTVHLPTAWQWELELDTVSADAELTALTLRELEFDTVSGDLGFSGVISGTLHFDAVSGGLEAEGSCGVLESDTTSGSVSFTGTADRAEVSTVSGDSNLNLRQTPNSVEFDSTSGSLKLRIPGERSFRAKLNTASGELYSAWELRDDRYTGENTDEADFRFDTVSGSVHLQEP